MTATAKWLLIAADRRKRQKAKPRRISVEELAQAKREYNRAMSEVIERLYFDAFAAGIDAYSTWSKVPAAFHPLG